jgi:hypothetical protein
MDCRLQTALGKFFPKAGQAVASLLLQEYSAMKRVFVFLFLGGCAFFGSAVAVTMAPKVQQPAAAQFQPPAPPHVSGAHQ